MDEKHKCIRGLKFGDRQNQIGRRINTEEMDSEAEVDPEDIMQHDIVENVHNNDDDDTDYTPDSDAEDETDLESDSVEENAETAKVHLDEDQIETYDEVNVTLN